MSARLNALDGKESNSSDGVLRCVNNENAISLVVVFSTSLVELRQARSRAVHRRIMTPSSVTCTQSSEQVWHVIISHLHSVVGPSLTVIISRVFFLLRSVVRPSLTVDRGFYTVCGCRLFSRQHRCSRLCLDRASPRKYEIFLCR